MHQQAQEGRISQEVVSAQYVLTRSEQIEQIAGKIAQLRRGMDSGGGGGGGPKKAVHVKVR
eukprot:scaffold3968_cov140-Skeletonema_menzelii.AAC.4